jgi:hypothetical protein
MAKEFLSAIRPPVVSSLPSGSIGDTVVLSTNGHLYTHDGSAWVDNGASGGGGGSGGPLGSGFATLDFGASSFDARTTIAAPAITATSSVKAWVRPIKSALTSNREEDEQVVEPLRVLCKNIVPATSFDVVGLCDFGTATGLYGIAWEHY